MSQVAYRRDDTPDPESQLSAGAPATDLQSTNLSGAYRRHGLLEALRKEQTVIEATARKEGLTFFPICYELVNYDQISVIAARDGFPTRYPHWRFGQAYKGFSERYRHGLAKIYEMVINSDPTYAYLLDSNSMADHRFVMAHVCGHADFFKNNINFAHTNRKSLDMMGNHASRVSAYIDTYGRDTVEKFIDACLSVDDLIDPHSVFKADPPAEVPAQQSAPSQGRTSTIPWYMKNFITAEDQPEEETEDKHKAIPEQPTRDVLEFVIEHGPLKDWQKDILGIIREESYYFLPQLQTKIMNEGWASYWHYHLMTTDLPDPSTVVEMGTVHGGVLGKNAQQLNPYLLGLLLYRDIEERWNKGQFGPEWEHCADRDARMHWDKKLELGRGKIFQVRRLYNDYQFISEFFTPEFCEKYKFFVYSESAYTGDLVIRSREFDQIKGKLLGSLHNAGRPILQVTDGNYLNRGELLLEHVNDGIGLDVSKAEETLRNLQILWRRPVNVKTIVDEKPVILSYDGTTHSIKEEGA